MAVANASRARENETELANQIGAKKHFIDGYTTSKTSAACSDSILSFDEDEIAYELIDTEVEGVLWTIEI